MRMPSPIRRWVEAPPSPLVVALVATGVMVPVTLLGILPWMTPPDVYPFDFNFFGPSGAALLQGRWSDVFRVAGVQAGPFELLPYGVADVLHVRSVAAATVFYTASGAALTFGVAMLAHPGRGSGPRGALIGAASAVLVAVQMLPAHAVMMGHPAEVVVPLLWLVAARLARRDRAVQAAAVVALSAGFEIWGVLGAAVVLLAERPRLLRSAAACTTVLALLYGPFALTGHFAMFGFRWPVAAVSIFHAVWPSMTTFPWTLRLLQGAATLVVSGAAAILTRGSAWSPWIVVISVTSTRLLLDPVLSGYYWFAPAVAVSTLVVAAAVRRDLPVLLLGAACDLACSLPVAPLTRASMLLALAVLAAVAVASQLRRRIAPASGRSGSTPLALAPPA